MKALSVDVGHASSALTTKLKKHKSEDQTEGGLRPPPISESSASESHEDVNLGLGASNGSGLQDMGLVARTS